MRIFSLILNLVFLLPNMAPLLKKVQNTQNTRENEENKLENALCMTKRGYITDCW